jgi:hypothetical protein
MNKKPSIEDRRSRLNKLSEAVFGGPEEISREEARELLRSAGIDADTIADAVYARLYKQAQEYWMAQKPLPPLLEKAIEDLRPSTASPRNEKEMATQAKARIERAVEQSRHPHTWMQSTTPEFRPSAYRGKKKLSKKDESALDEIAKRLNDKLKGPQGS